MNPTAQTNLDNVLGLQLSGVAGKAGMPKLLKHMPPRVCKPGAPEEPRQIREPKASHTTLQSKFGKFQVFLIFVFSIYAFST